MLGASFIPHVGTWNIDDCIYQTKSSTNVIGLFILVVIVAIVCPVVAFVYVSVNDVRTTVVT